MKAGCYACESGALIRKMLKPETTAICGRGSVSRQPMMRINNARYGDMGGTAWLRRTPSGSKSATPIIVTWPPTIGVGAIITCTSLWPGVRAHDHRLFRRFFDQHLKRQPVPPLPLPGDPPVINLVQRFAFRISDFPPQWPGVDDAANSGLPARRAGRLHHCTAPRDAAETNPAAARSAARQRHAPSPPTRRPDRRACPTQTRSGPGSNVGFARSLDNRAGIGPPTLSGRHPGSDLRPDGARRCSDGANRQLLGLVERGRVPPRFRAATH